jgi:hypothetical protein
MFKSLFYLAAAASCLLGVHAQTKPDPTKVWVQSISYGGTGCPQGSVGTSIANDRQSFTLIFDKFVASSGPGVAMTEARKNCQINLNLNYPPGYSYAIGTVDYRGYAQLPAGVSAEQKSIYYFQGELQQVSSGTKLTGPVSKDYLTRDTLAWASYAWAPCGEVRPVNINAQVRLFSTNGAATPLPAAQITTDSIDGKIQFVFGTFWRLC